MYYVYVLLSENGEKYVGYTNDVDRRLEEHNAGGNVSTRGRQWNIVYYEAFLTKRDAQERERKLKQDGRSRRFLYQRIARSLS